MARAKNMAGTARCSECGVEAVHEAGPKSPLVIRHGKGCSQAPRSVAGRRGAAATQAKRAAAGKKAAKPKPQPRECLCGCGNMTKGGSFLQGHDARYKSELVRRGLQEEPAALAELEARGWTKFLDKAREIATRPVAERVERVAQQKEERIEDSIERYEGQRQAADRLKIVKRYTKRSELGQLTITRHNWRIILDLSDKQLTRISQAELDELAQPSEVA